MASKRLDTPEKIVRMTEWGNAEPWEYSESEQKVKDPLAAAKRYVSAQAFLLSWQEGKVPTGWRRPRRLMDFEGKYPQQVLDEVSDTMAKRISERNLEKTAQINAVLTATRGKEMMSNLDSPLGGDNELMKKHLSKIELNNVKKDMNDFSSQLHEAKSALRLASNTAADISLRLEALTTAIERN